MRLTQKIKSTIKLLKEIETEGEKCENNYININHSKYYVFKNNLYKSQKYNKPVGTIKNGRIVLKRHKSIETLKSVQNGIRKIQSKKLKLKSPVYSTINLPDSPTPENPFSEMESPLSETNIKPSSSPFELTEKTEKFEDSDSEPLPEALPEALPETLPETLKTESFEEEPFEDEKNKSVDM